MAYQQRCEACAGTGNDGYEHYCSQGGSHTEYQPMSRMVTNPDGTTGWVTEQVVVQRHCDACCYRAKRCHKCKGFGWYWIS